MQKLYVGKNREYKSISDILSLIKPYTTIYLDNGIYHEKIKINCDNISIIGESENNTIISFSDYALKIHKDGKEFNTFRTPTLHLLGKNIELKNLTIKNESGIGKIYGQAVALSLTGDNITLDHVTLEAHQDTLFLGPLPKDLQIRYLGFLENDELVDLEKRRYLIKSSKIIGDVDFIFGTGNAYFLNCEIISNGDGFITAPATEKEDFYGFTFFKCKFLKYNANHVYLSRPWRDYGKAVFIDCLYDNHIIDLGFDKWNDTDRDKTARFYEHNSFYIDHHDYQRVYFTKTLDEDELNLYDQSLVLK